MESSQVEGSSSQGLGKNSTASPFAATRTPHENPTLEDNEINRTTNNSGNMEEEEEESSHFESKKRKMTSKVWNEFIKIKLPDGHQKAECHYCKSKLSWEHTSRASIKNDCVKVYEIEKKKLKNYLQGHFVDSNWRLQKRVLSFIHLSPPHRGTDIADNLYKCFKIGILRTTAYLAPETFEVLLCGRDWCRSLHGLKRKNKKEKMPIEVILPIT
nr:zinc finger BED domain-containing protein RICESLEEPER 2-like [Tanacetum cinerariifolium]